MRQMTEREDRNATILLQVFIIAMYVVMSACVLADVMPGTRYGHPPEYLLSTYVATSLLISVIPILRLTGVVRMPWWFNLLLVFDLYFYSISLSLGFYMNDDIAWWGFLGHVMSAICIGAIVFLALCVIEKQSPVRVTLGSRAGVILITMLITISFGGIWEVMEGYVDIIVGQAYMSYGVFDSLDDLRADVLGAIFMAIIAAFIMRKKSAADVASNTVVRNPFKGRKKDRV